MRDGREGVTGQRADARVVGEPQLPDPDVALEGPGQQGPEERVKFNQGISEANIVPNMNCNEPKYWVKGCRQTLDCYCVSCELLSASIADALLFVNILV